MTFLWRTVVFIAVIGTAPRLAQAEPRSEPPAAAEQAPAITSPSSLPSTSPWKLVLGAGTDFPVSVGARAHVEGPYRLRLSSSLGVLPAPYVDVINGIVVGLGGYSDATAELVKAAIRSSLIWRTHLGIRPFERLGLYAEAGYGLVTLGGEATALAIIEGVTGRSLPEGARSGGDFDASASLHMLDVEVGYEIPLSKRLELRVALGGAFTLASSTSIRPAYSPRAPNLVKAFTDYGEQYLDDTFTSYVFTPVLSLSLGYSLL